MKRRGCRGRVAVVAIAGYLWLTPAGDAGSIDLVEAFRAAEKRTPLDPGAAFSIDPQTIKGETKPSIYAHPPSRIIFHDVKVPAHARLEVFLGIREEAWPKGTDGVTRVGCRRRRLQGFCQAQRRPIGRRRQRLDTCARTGGLWSKTVACSSTPMRAPGVVPNELFDFAFSGPRIGSCAVCRRAFAGRASSASFRRGGAGRADSTAASAEERSDRRRQESSRWEFDHDDAAGVGKQ